MNITYRKFTPGDADAALALSREWAEEFITFGVVPDSLEEISARPDDYFFIASDGGELVGYVYAEVVRGNRFNVFPRGSDFLRVDSLYVTRSRRGRGVGAKLLALAENEAAENGIYNVMVSSATRDAENIRRFYARCGYGVWSTDFYKRMKTDTRTYDFGFFGFYRFVVIFARYKGKWLYSRRADRDTWETPGGHIEPGETPESAARRELWEETGATAFELRPAFDYSVHTPSGFSEGQVFVAEISELGPLPGFEMCEVTACETYPEKLTYPEILPVLYERVINPDRPAFEIVPVAADNRVEVTEFITRRWLSDRMLIRGEEIDMTAVDGFVLFEHGELTGCITYIFRGNACEVTLLDSVYGGRGVGRALLDSVKTTARGAGCRTLRLLTTNDNIEAIKFYQMYGFELAGAHLGAIDRERALKPEIPRLGRHGIPLRHEIDFEMNIGSFT